MKSRALLILAILACTFLFIDGLVEAAPDFEPDLELPASTPNLAIGKTGPSSALPGELIEYTLVVANTGSVAATNLLITDTVPSGATHASGGTLVGTEVQWSIAELGPNGAFTTTTFAVTAASTITNDEYGVSADGGFSAAGSNSVVTLVGEPTLTISKTGPTSAAAGSPVEYTLTVQNNGTLTATNLLVKDTLPSGATYLSGGTPVGNEVQWSIAELAPGGASVDVNFTVSGMSTLVNDTYSVSADNGYSATGSTAVTTQIGAPSLTITKDGPALALPGAPIQYVLTVQNNGTFTATGVTVSDTIPAGATWLSGGTPNGGVVEWSIGDLGPSQQQTVSFSVTANSTITNDDYGASSSNGASATGSDTVVTVVGQAQLTIDKTGPAIAFPGDPIVYTLTIGNGGVYTATNVEVLDVVPMGATYVSGGSFLAGVVTWDIAELAPASQQQVQFTVTANNSIVNSSYGATADGGLSVSGTTPVSTIVGTPALSLSKTGPATAFTNTPFTYTISLQNSGVLTASNVLVRDTLPGGATYVSGGTQVGNEVQWTIAELGPADTETLQFFVQATSPTTLVNSTYSAEADGGFSATGSNSVTTVVGSPSLSISKSGPSTAFIGENIGYNLTVSNNGTLTATNLLVTDQLPAGSVYVGSGTGGVLVGNEVQWSVSSLAPSSQANLGFTVKRNSAGTVTNSTYGVSADGGFNASGSQTVTTTVGDPVLSISKSGPSLVFVGDTITYNLTVRNDGTLRATNLVITDTVPAGATHTGGGTLVGGDTVQWTVSQLNPNTSDTVQFSVTRNTPGTVTNSDYGVIADGGFAASGSQSVATVVGEPNLSITKTGPGSVGFGTPIEYTITVNNSGAYTATNLLVRDTVPTGATYVSGGTLVGNEVQWTLAQLAPMTSAQFNFTVSASNTVVNSTYSVSADGGYGATGTDSVTTAINEPNLTITKSGPATAYVGEQFSYTLLVQNIGSVTATGVQVTDELPANATWVSGGSFDGTNVTWSLGNVPVGSPVPLNFTVTATDSTLNDTYSVTSNGGFGDIGTDEVFTLVGEPDLTISKTGPATAFSGDPIVYRLNIGNSGTLTATNVTVVDELPTDAAWVSGGSLQGRTVTWNVGDMEPGDSDTLLLTVTANQTVTNDTYRIEADRGYRTDGTNSVTTVVGTPSLSITKAGPSSAQAGTNFTYDVTVTNSGTMTATNLVVTDLIPLNAIYVSSSDGGVEGGTGTVTWNIASLGMGASKTVRFTVTTDAAFVGPITNSTYGVTSDGGFSASGSTSVVTNIGTPGLRVTKVGPAFVYTGDTVQYTLTATNAGTLTATNLVITDVVPAGAAYVSSTAGGTLSGGVVTWNVGQLTPNATVVRSLTVRAANASVASITNDTYGISADGTQFEAGSPAVTTTFGEPDLFISKSGPATAFVDAPVTYSLTVLNVGPLPALNATVTDTLPAGATYVSGGTLVGNEVRWNIGDLAPLTGSATVEFVVTGSSTLVNDDYGVSANNGDFTASGDTSVTTLIGDPSLSITKRGPSHAISGQPFAYTIEVTNNGGLAATNLEITDELPLGATYVSGGTLNGNTVSWSIATLPAGGSAEVQLVVSATSTVVNDTYAVTADGGFSAEGSTTVTTLVGLPSLSIEKSGPVSVGIGDPIVYQLTVRNTSAFTATNLGIVDVLPTGATYVSGGTLVGSEVRWSVPVLAPGDSIEVSFTVTAEDDIVNDDYSVSADFGVFAIGSVAVTTRVGSPLLFLPMVATARPDEPNDSCGAAFPINVNVEYAFFANDDVDWYQFDLTASGSIDFEVLLTNFEPLDGQIGIFKGDTCEEAQFLQNNGSSSTSKTLSLTGQSAGRYFVYVTNDGGSNTQDPYNLEVAVAP